MTGSPNCASEACASVTIAREGGLTVARLDRPGLRELYLSAAPAAPSTAAGEAEWAYEALTCALHEAGAVGVQERVFGSLECADEILATRERVLSPWFARTTRWPAAFIEGSPPGRTGLSGVHLYAVAGPECTPIRVGERLCGMRFEHAGMTQVYVTSPAVGGPDCRPGDAAQRMIRNAQSYLHSQGAGYRDVVRTWIYLRNILDWYGAFNEVRSGLYAEWGLADPGSQEFVPASTGIAGRPRDGHWGSMDVLALVGPGRAHAQIRPLHNPLQNEAYSYGSAFSRAMSVDYGGLDVVYVSGTAAIDEQGRSVNVGDLEGQVVKTLENVDALIGTRGMSLDDIVTSTVFIKPGQDANVVRRVIAAGGGGTRYGAVMMADVCRPELLFEFDAVAVRVVT